MPMVGYKNPFVYLFLINLLPIKIILSLSLGSSNTHDIASLLENAKNIDDNLANGEKLGKYSESSWSNR
jgi:hypothetical protein